MEKAGRLKAQQAPPPLTAPAGLPARHLILVLVVIAIWGTNFVVIHEGLQHFPPLLFATLRFLLCAFPAALFLPMPVSPWRSLIGYGLLIGAGQFGLLYIAIDGHIAPGLASLVIQLQVPFTIALSTILLGETFQSRQLVTFALCALGLAAVASANEGSTTLLGLALVLASAASWACANILVKTLGSIRMVPFIVWSSLAAVPPLAALSVIFEGPAIILESLRSASVSGWAAVVWQSVGNTLFGFAAWSWLLARYPASSVTPAAILVPIFGLGSSALLLGEPMPYLKLVGAALILSGVSLEFALSRRRNRRAATQ